MKLNYNIPGYMILYRIKTNKTCFIYFLNTAALLYVWTTLLNESSFSVYTPASTRGDLPYSGFLSICAPLLPTAASFPWPVLTGSDGERRPSATHS